MNPVEIVRRTVPASAHALTAAGISPVLARIYAARGIEGVAELDHRLAALPSFVTLKNIDLAAQRLCHAIVAREKIVIVADYDADGATACAIGLRGLRSFGAAVDFIVPNRFEFGYGLTPEIVALAAQMSPRLLVTVDNGIASVEGVAAAATRGIDVLITDHHLPGAVLPSPAIIVNPNQHGCTFPSKDIAGVGVMFYVLTATRALLRERGAFLLRPEPNLAHLLDLVALGTVADVVKLDHVNRILVTQGLARIRAGRAQPGVAALLTVAGRDPLRATVYDLGFCAGPRLNAAGRLADMSLGIACLIAEHPGQALSLATQLDRLNQERREVEATMQEEALAEIDGVATTGEQCSLCLYRADWHQGVVGIVASRLKDRFHRPAIVFARGSNGELKGSGRSIAGFHLRDALDLVTKRAPDIVAKFGGHAFAAGLTIREESLARFAAAFEDVASEQLTPAQLHRMCASDGALPMGDLTLELAVTLCECVWGQGMPAPTFDDWFEVEEAHVVGDRHTRMTLRRGGEHFDAIVFRCTDPLPQRIHAAFHPVSNDWHGVPSLELIVDHWQPG